MIWLVSILLLLSLVLNGFLLWKSFQFARVIMVVEDELGDALETLEDVDESLEGFLAFKLFFDNEELQRIISDAKKDVDLAKIAVSRLIGRFVEFSKEKFTVEVDNEDVSSLKQHVRQSRTKKQQRERAVEAYLDTLG